MPKDTRMVEAFIDLIKFFRKKDNLTIEQLADLAGVHRTTIGLLERKERYPTLQLADQIANALGYQLSELIQKSEFNYKVQYLKNYNSKRQPNTIYLRNEKKLIKTIGITGNILLQAINSCYKTLDTIDEQLISKGSPPLAHLVELANLSSMVGNIVGGGIAESSNGLYIRNKPHTYPDLLPLKKPAVNLELKIALETNKPKGHLPKKGTYIIFRYILGDQHGNYVKGKEHRGDTVWIWEVKVGNIVEDDFSCSNTVGDSGKTATIKTPIFNKMSLVYYVPQHVPYSSKQNMEYVGFN